MADHLVHAEDRDKLTTVVYGEGQSDEFWENGGTSRPSLDRSLAAALDGIRNLLSEVRIDKGAFLY